MSNLHIYIMYLSKKIHIWTHHTLLHKIKITSVPKLASELQKYSTRDSSNTAIEIREEKLLLYYTVTSFPIFFIKSHYK